MMIGELQKLIEPAVTALGYELWGCEWVSAGKNQRLLRVYVDSEQGVTVAACSKISRQIGAIFDVENPIIERYLLEVSSPGIERLLFTVLQCERYIGQPISVRLRVPVGGRRNFKGILQSAGGAKIVLQLEDPQKSPVELEWRDIEKAHLATPVFPAKQGKK